jgi:hypothetical protein
LSAHGEIKRRTGVGGADHWVAIATVIETSKLKEINPLSYPTD